MDIISTTDVVKGNINFGNNQLKKYFI